MKEFITTLFLTLTVTIALAQKKTKGYIIEGTINGVDTGMIHLTHFAGPVHSDSARIVKGKFRFYGRFESPIPVAFTTSDTNARWTLIFAENAHIKIVMDTTAAKGPVVTGSVSHKKYEEFESTLKPFNDQSGELYRLSQIAKKNNLPTDSIDKVWEKVAEQRKAAARELIQSNPGSVVSAYFIYNYFGPESDPKELLGLYNALTPAVQQSVPGMDVANTIEKIDLTSVGRVAPEFTLHDTLERPVSLSSFRGKYVLIDFWASWCGPCRAENPDLIKALNKYKDRNFTILGVSLDGLDSKQEWLDAIREDGLGWTHVTSKHSSKHDAADDYGVMSVPTNFLLDPAGKIIGKNLHGEKLHQALEALPAPKTNNPR